MLWKILLYTNIFSPKKIIIYILINSYFCIPPSSSEFLILPNIIKSILKIRRFLMQLIEIILYTNLIYTFNFCNLNPIRGVNMHISKYHTICILVFEDLHKNVFGGKKRTFCHIQLYTHTYIYILERFILQDIFYYLFS